MPYDREPKYLHPYIASKLQNILAAINSKLPSGHVAKLISAHRTPADQFQLYKQGRVFRNGLWTKTGNVVTNLDGYIKLSRHNYLPCTAFDTGIFNGSAYLPNSPLYKFVREGVRLGMNWGGDWTKFPDRPHLEVPKEAFFKGNIDKDFGLVWQAYLKRAGAYKGAMDGIFGAKSLSALAAVTGENSRSLVAWDKLFARFGMIENYKTE